MTVSIFIDKLLKVMKLWQKHKKIGRMPDDACLWQKLSMSDSDHSLAGKPSANHMEASRSSLEEGQGYRCNSEITLQSPNANTRRVTKWLFV